MGEPLGKDEIQALKGILFILPLVALGFFAYAFYWVTFADTASGVVVSTNSTRAYTGRVMTTSWTSMVEYTLEDGQSFTSKESWPSTFFKYDIGDEITVYYFSDAPENILLGYRSSLTEITIAILFGWLFLMWIYFFRLKGRK